MFAYVFVCVFSKRSLASVGRRFADWVQCVACYVGSFVSSAVAVNTERSALVCFRLLASCRG